MSGQIQKKDSRQNHEKAGNALWTERNFWNMKHSVVINDCRHAELSGYRQAGRNGGSQDSDAPAADGHQKDAEESGGIQIPGHTAQGDLFPDCQKDVKDQQDAAGSVDHEADTPEAYRFCQKSVETHHGRLQDARQKYKK